MSNQHLTNDGNLNFASSSVKKQEQQKQDNIKKNLNDNKVRSQNAKSFKKDFKKVNTIVDAGKSFIDKFLQGFSSIKRANITSDLDDTLPFRLSEVYQQSIQSHADMNIIINPDEKARELNNKFIGAISLGMAIKLNKSAPELEKKSNFLLSAISSVKVKLPKKLSILIDQLGKTDLPNDNHFRLNNQNFAAKRHLLRGILFMLGENGIKDFLVDEENYNAKDFSTLIGTDSKFRNMVDSSNWSVDRVHQIGKESFDRMSKTNLIFKHPDIQEKEWEFRIPDFKVKEDTTIAEVSKYIKNGIFTDFNFSKEDVTRVCAGLLLQIAPAKWIRQSKKTMGDLNSSFQGSFLSSFTFDQVMAYCDVWNVNNYLSDNDINDLAIQSIHRWNSGIAREFEKFLDIVEHEFNDYGTEAQLVQVEGKFSNKKIENSFFELDTYRLMGKARSTVPLKVSNNAAILGVISRFTRNIEFSSDFEINHDKVNRDILYQFLKNDNKY